MNKRRIKWFGVCVLLGLVVLIVRLVQIQLVSTESFSDHNINLIEASVNQRSQNVLLDDGRGKFYDRNGEALIHEEKPVLVLFPFLEKMDWPSEKVAAIIGVSESTLQRQISEADDPFAFGEKDPVELTDDETKKINALKIPGVFAVKQKFIEENIPAAQLIGTTVKYSSLSEEKYPELDLTADTRIGDKGLQHTFDEFLLSGGESKLVYHVDANGGPMFGVDVKYLEPANPLYPVKVITTLDKDLQTAAEKIVDEHQIKKGGIVLLDIEKSEILALVSRPALDPKDPNGEGAINYMLTQKAPGSVFKTLVAAAAVDTEVVSPNRLFNCSVTIDGEQDQQHQLGMLNFENSFASSCNRAFAETANDIAAEDPDFFTEYAKKLGLTGESGWQGDVYHTFIKQLYNEDEGKIWHDVDLKHDAKMVAKTAIGQQDVQVTPLAVANMMATIARGGEKQMVKAVKKVELNNGTTVIDFPKQTINENNLSPYTAMKLQSLLRSVVTNPNGTGAALNGLPYEVAGKSGTAQIDIEKGTLNKWFAGYFPYKNPKYALVAASFDTTANSGSMTSVFADLVKEISKQTEQTLPIE
jgi:penicillin-binding protein 4B